MLEVSICIRLWHFIFCPYQRISHYGTTMVQVWCPVLVITVNKRSCHWKITRKDNCAVPVNQRQPVQFCPNYVFRHDQATSRLVEKDPKMLTLIGAEGLPHWFQLGILRWKDVEWLPARRLAFASVLDVFGIVAFDDGRDRYFTRRKICSDIVISVITEYM